jgi:hypothetical protein
MHRSRNCLWQLPSTFREIPNIKDEHAKTTNSDPGIEQATLLFQTGELINIAAMMPRSS